MYRPYFFRLRETDQRKDFDSLLQNKNISVYDTIYSQLTEYVKIQHPDKKLSIEEIDAFIKEHLKDQDIYTYGVWVFYPWSNKLIHILDEEEFITVRANRNLYKILPEEIQQLKKKKIGIIGLSVGQAIAMTMATERICGEMRLADFDRIELTNLNRLTTSLYELGEYKVIIAARRIAELDPFIKVICFIDGIHENNIDDFFTKDGKIDILVEECDGIDIKILSRIKARELKIPVVMETNDRGMLDIERFDLEPYRKILHSSILELENYDDETMRIFLKNMSPKEKFNIISKIINLNDVSESMKFSFEQINKTISAWPQLSSSVSLGAAIATDSCRKILLNKFSSSGRYFLDLDQLIK